MANEKYFLQMAECKWPDHVFISRKKTFKICIYHKDSKKQHPSLYCVTNDSEAYPISIELLNSKNKVIRESNTQSNGHSRYKKLWTIISASTDFKIKHSYCEFSIQFDSLPPYYDQPLRFRFKATSNNAKIPMIEPFTTRPFRVVRYQLRISCGPPSTFYKDDGGMRNNHMTVKVELLNPGKNGNAKRHKMSVPLKCKLMTEDGKEITGTMKKKGHYSETHTKTTKQKQKLIKSRPPLHYLQLHEDCLSPKISSVSGECIVKFRINDVSQNHKNQGFHVIVQPNIQKLPHLCEIYECRSSKIIVKSKSPEKLNSQGTSKKRRSTRSRAKKDDTSYNDISNCKNKSKSGRGHKKRKKSKSKRKHKHDHDLNEDDEYKPHQSDNNDDSMNIDENNIMNESAIKIESDLNIGNHLRKRRKLNGSRYVKTNGVECMQPKTFNVPPKHHWFPSISIHGTLNVDKDKDKQMNGIHGPESEIQIFAQNCFEMLQFREWICIGYQTQYIDDIDDKNDKLQIVRCLLCGADGVWTHSTPPRHKKGCDFVKLKRSYHQMQLGSNHDHHHHHPHHHNHPTMYYQTPIISPKMSNLPPLPQPHPNRFIPPAFPPPFFGPIPPMFPPNPMPPYHVLNHAQPPPLIQAQSTNTIDTKGSNKLNKKTDKTKNGLHGKHPIAKIKTQQSNNKQNDDNDRNMNRKSSPLMFPFGHQSPQMFPNPVGPMQSPLFSINNVPQTPQLFSQPLSGNAANNSNGVNANGSMFTLPPGSNPSTSGLANNHHLSINTHSLPSFGQTASSLPMPLQLPMNSCSILSANKDKDKDKDKENEKNHKVHKKTGKENHMASFHSSCASSICNTAAATMGSPTATIRSNPPQSKSGTTPHNMNHNTPNTRNDDHEMDQMDQMDQMEQMNQMNQMAVSVDSAISRLSQSASLSAVATAGGLTISTPFAETSSLSINTNHHHNDHQDANDDGIENKSNNNSNDDHSHKDSDVNKDTSQIIAAHAPPLLPRYIISPQHILNQNSSNNSIETQIGSMPPLHPDTNTCSSNKSQSSISPRAPTSSNDKPLHQRRLMEHAPTTLSIPSVTTNTTPFANIHSN